MQIPELFNVISPYAEHAKVLPPSKNSWEHKQTKIVAMDGETNKLKLVLQPSYCIAKRVLWAYDCQPKEPRLPPPVLGLKMNQPNAPFAIIKSFPSVKETDMPGTGIKYAPNVSQIHPQNTVVDPPMVNSDVSNVHTLLVP